ncbi:MAG: LysR family transcriptional regulator, partial [Rhodobacteraceae bacterium]|nr:LysR family transcriptional regulator [Paracoccaceae bacterium]
MGAREWRLGRDESRRVPVAPRLQVATIDGAVAAALAGWGLTRVFSYQVARHVAAGRLRAVLVEEEPAPVPIHVLHAHEGRAPAIVRLLFDRLVEGLRADPAIDRE